MAAVGERRSLPSPEAMLGQPWSHWVDAAKLHGNDGTALEESFKEYGRNREAMRLCREDVTVCVHHNVEEAQTKKEQRSYFKTWASFQSFCMYNVI
ncbi:ataxin-7-like protein [Willisornis vidua]|uniref:Ataxin-7-like protein n=1 Tax=Willisornis vidua TaxID=1566151 RepID=A0ABQ9CT74_9PASS|nr:ataxin-7-like protein [Willisornis vidua]